MKVSAFHRPSTHFLSRFPQPCSSWPHPVRSQKGMLATPPTDSDILAIADRLPSAPRLLVELDRLMAHPRCDIDDIAGVLKQDPPLIAQILRMANSPVYSPAEPIGHLDQALSVIGFTEIHRLVGAVAAHQLSRARLVLYPVTAEQLRRHTLYVAVLMEQLAKAAKESPRRAYTIGMLRSLGMMALELLAPAGQSIPAFQTESYPDLQTWERTHWGLTNVEVTEKILLHWQLPRETVQAIRYHTDPGRRHNPMIHLLLLAATATAERFSSIPGEEPYWNPKLDTLAKAGLTSNYYQHACERAAAKYEKLCQALG